MHSDNTCAFCNDSGYVSDGSGVWACPYKCVPKSLEVLQEDLNRLRDEVKDSIRHDPPHTSEGVYVLVDDELPPYAYWVLEKPLMQMYEVRRQMFQRMYPQKDVDPSEEA